MVNTFNGCFYVLQFLLIAYVHSVCWCFIH